MDSNYMNHIAKSTQNIKRFSSMNVTKNKTAWIRVIFGICFNGFSVINYIFNLSQRNTSGIASPLAMTSNQIFTGIKFLSYLFNHKLKTLHNYISKNKLSQGFWRIWANLTMNKIRKILMDEIFYYSLALLPNPLQNLRNCRR